MLSYMFMRQTCSSNFSGYFKYIFLKFNNDCKYFIYVDRGLKRRVEVAFPTQKYTLIVTLN